MWVSKGAAVFCSAFFSTVQEEKEMEQELLSIGIDVGTSTTQVVFCCLHLEEEASYGRAPHVKITDKKVIYLSFSGRKSSGLCLPECRWTPFTCGK